jgi:hypothetical protein
MRPTIYDLWRQAAGDGEKYRALMLEHGYVRLRRPDEPKRGLDDPLLPCGITMRRLGVAPTNDTLGSAGDKTAATDLPTRDAGLKKDEG